MRNLREALPFGHIGAHCPCPGAGRLVMSKPFEPERDEPRPLTTLELRRLRRHGFSDLALDLAADRCPHCGLNPRGVMHSDLCPAGERRRATQRARPTPTQPWEPKPSGGAS